MPSSSRYFLVFLLFTPLLLAKNKDKQIFPKLIVKARYVMVTTYFGDLPSDTRIMPSDRHAMADVQTAIQKWGHYSLAYRREDAKLIIVVRKGRYAETLAGVRIHGGSDQPNPSIAPDIQADVGDPQDMVAVYDASLGIDSPTLWRSRQRDGLEPPDMKLVQKLRTEVETAARQP
jgi:hypothetical protein